MRQLTKTFHFEGNLFAQLGTDGNGMVTWHNQVSVYTELPILKFIVGHLVIFLVYPTDGTPFDVVEHLYICMY